VLILKVVKVLCFDTLLQVLILKGLSVRAFGSGLGADRQIKTRLLDWQASRRISGRTFSRG